MKPSWRPCRYAVGPRTQPPRVHPPRAMSEWHPVRSESGCHCLACPTWARPVRQVGHHLPRSGQPRLSPQQREGKQKRIRRGRALVHGRTCRSPAKHPHRDRDARRSADCNQDVSRYTAFNDSAPLQHAGAYSIRNPRKLAPHCPPPTSYCRSQGKKAPAWGPMLAVYCEVVSLSALGKSTDSKRFAILRAESWGQDGCQDRNRRIPVGCGGQHARPSTPKFHQSWRSLRRLLPW